MSDIDILLDQLGEYPATLTGVAGRTRELASAAAAFTSVTGREDSAGAAAGFAEHLGALLADIGAALDHDAGEVSANAGDVARGRPREQQNGVPTWIVVITERDGREVFRDSEAYSSRHGVGITWLTGTDELWVVSADVGTSYFRQDAAGSWTRTILGRAIMTRTCQPRSGNSPDGEVPPLGPTDLTSP